VSIESGNSESGIEHNTTCACFSVIVTLSEDGMQHVFDVITAVFQYLHLLWQVGPQLNIFNEIKTIDDNEFLFQESDDPQDYVEQLCVNMQLYPPEHYITGDQLMFDYNEQVIRQCTESLSADKVNIMILSNSYSQPGLCDLKEKWYKTSYHVEDIPRDWLDKWLSPDNNADIFLPTDNIYIATDFTLNTTGVAADSQYPTVIHETSVSRLWYKSDTKFKVPRAYIKFYLRIPSIAHSPHSMCLTELYVKLLLHNLAEQFYEAELAELTYDVKALSSGIVLKFGGFSHKLPLLVRGVTDYIAEFTVSDKQFQVIKRDLETVYTNLLMKPHKLNGDVRLSLLQNNYWTLSEKHSVLLTLELEHLQRFTANDLFGAVHVDGLVQGNMTQDVAISLEEHLLSRLQLKHLPDCFSTDISVCSLPLETVTVFRVKNRNIDDNNCVITNYYQHGPANIHEYALMDLLMTYMEEPCFDYLRTRKQLGYHVDCGIRNTYGILGYTVMVSSHSSKFSMKYLDEQIEEFLSDLSRRIDKLTSKKFNKLVKSLITLRCIDDLNLNDETNRNWAEIVDQTYLFDRHHLEVERLKAITVDEFKKWSTSHLLPGGPNRKKLGIQVLGNKNLKVSKKNGNVGHKRSSVSGRQQHSDSKVLAVKGQRSEVSKGLRTSLLPTAAEALDVRTKLGLSKSVEGVVQSTAGAGVGRSSDVISTLTTESTDVLSSNVTTAAEAGYEDDDLLLTDSNAKQQTTVQKAEAATDFNYPDSVQGFRQTRVFYPPSKILP
jgi:nardilysin